MHREIKTSNAKKNNRWTTNTLLRFSLKTAKNHRCLGDRMFRRKPRHEALETTQTVVINVVISSRWPYQTRRMILLWTSRKVAILPLHTVKQFTPEGIRFWNKRNSYHTSYHDDFEADFSKYCKGGPNVFTRKAMRRSELPEERQNDIVFHSAWSCLLTCV